jgi:hypothetical protein
METVIENIRSRSTVLIAKQTRPDGTSPAGTSLAPVTEST